MQCVIPKIPKNNPLPKKLKSDCYYSLIESFKSLFVRIILKGFSQFHHLLSGENQQKIKSAPGIQLPSNKTNLVKTHHLKYKFWIIYSSFFLHLYAS